MKKLTVRLFLVQIFALIAVTSIRTNTAYSITIVQTGDPTALTNAVVGSDLNIVGVPTYVGSPSASGTFLGGMASGIGIESGIILTSGNAAEAVGPNNNGFVHETLGGGEYGDDTSSDLGLSGDPALTTLAGFDTYDASVLEFNFTTPTGNIFFNYVFASEEYIDWVDTEFNDVFGFYVDGINIGVVPGTLDPISVNTINPISNSSFYNNNIDPANFDLEYDGFTAVMTASLSGLSSGNHHIKLAIADGSDNILDAAVFIQTSFLDQPPPNVIPEPSTFLLLDMGLLGLALKKWSCFF